MEPKINLKNVSFAAQCTEAREEVVPHFVSDKIVEKVDGKSYSLKNHGLIRYNDVYLVNQTEEEITLGFDDNEETLILYPFKFHFEVTYKLENDKISIKYYVINKNDKTMYFSVGGHPALGVNLINGEFENVAIEVDGVFHKQYLLNEEGIQIVGERNIT